ncbi:unnamed protein product, partial [Ectocarpus sp. 8 AP-2014]
VLLRSTRFNTTNTFAFLPKNTKKKEAEQLAQESKKIDRRLLSPSSRRSTEDSVRMNDASHQIPRLSTVRAWGGGGSNEAPLVVLAHANREENRTLCKIQANGNTHHHKTTPS